jgi:hypothetical protein
MIWNYHPVVVLQEIYKITEIKGPGRIAMQHDNDLSLSLIKKGEVMSFYGFFSGCKWVECFVGHTVRFSLKLKSFLMVTQHHTKIQIENQTPSAGTAR